MTTRFTITTTLATVLALALPVAAEACWTTSTADADTGDTPFGRFYLANDCGLGCTFFSVWIYEESNNIPGLQRGDEVHDDTCGGQIPSDTIRF